MNIVLSNASARWGGVHNVTEMLARGLQSRGHHVVVLGRPGSMLEERMRSVAPFEPVLRGTDLHPLSLWYATQALRRHRADVVITLMKKDVRLTAVVARALGIPVVIRHPNDQPLPSGPRGRLLYAGAEMHVTNAEATRRTILESAPWLAPERVRVIYNGIDPVPFETALPIPLNLPDGAVRFGYVGSFERRKGLRVLAEAWRRVAAAAPAAHLLMAGKGSDEKLLRHMLEGAPRVHWLGYSKVVPNVMAALNVLVLPSFVEGAPNVVQEAMSAGIAVIATAVSGTPELVGDRSEALLVPSGDVNALASAMAEIAANADLRGRLAAAGHARVREAFTLDQMLDKYEALLAEVTGRD
jgi:glycosyltransferase involved in cell wall biosynthesis